MEKDVIISEVGSKRIIQLNRPKLMNAINQNILKTMWTSLKAWNTDPSVQLVIIKGNEKAFSSGGQLTDLNSFGKCVPDIIKVFYHVKHFSKPFVSLMDGIAMGGGLGLAANGRFIVATERTMVAMPEVHVGYYPDAASAHYLKGNFDLFLGLTGHRLKGADVYHAGLSTHYVSSKQLQDLKRRLLDLPEGSLSFSQVQKVLDDYHDSDLPSFSLEDYRQEIENSFSKSSLEEIVESLKKSRSKFIKEIHNTLLRLSPTALKVTFKHYRDSKFMTFDEVLEVENRLTRRFAKSSDDFKEGVRATFIDKDKNPKWTPSKLEHVTEEMVDFYFRPMENRDEEISFRESKL